MSDLQEKRLAAQNAEANRRAEADRLAQIAHETFRTEAGTELLAHLCRHFGLTGRSFLPDSQASLCPYRAAVRDGERAALSHIITLIKKANPAYPLPL
jgi:hypothetical protein